MPSHLLGNNTSGGLAEDVLAKLFIPLANILYGVKWL